MIINGSNTPLNVKTGTVPDVSGALKDYMQAMVFTRVVKKTVNFQVVERSIPINFNGLIQPFSNRQLQLKPEGERAWSWFLIHVEPGVILDVDEVVTYLGKQTRIMSRQDFTNFGFIEYTAIQDWEGSGPSPEV